MEYLFEKNVSDIDSDVSFFPSFETEKWNSFSKPAGAFDELACPGARLGSLNPEIENWN